MPIPNTEPAHTNEQPAQDDFSVKVLKAVGITLALLLLLSLAGATFHVLLLMMAGVLIAVFLRGIGSALSSRTAISEGWATALAALVLVGLLVLTAWLLAPSVADQADKLSKELPQALERLKAEVTRYKWAEKILHDISSDSAGILQYQDGWIGKSLGILSTSLVVLGDLYVILFLGIFFTVQPQLYKKGIIYLVPPRKRRRAREVISAIGNTLHDWLIGKAITMLIVAVCTATGLWLLDVPFALVLGLIAGLFSFVPNFGPLAALVPAVLIGLVEGPIITLYIIALYEVVHLVNSKFIKPLVQKEMIQLPPALIIISQLVLGVFSGVLGLILATPIIAVVIVLVKMLYIRDILGDESIEIQATDD